jgi:Protein of unknown function (DUF3224)
MSAESSDRTHATAKITVKTYEPQPYEDPDQGPQLVQINVVETFSGDIEGDGAAQFLQVSLADDDASFVGLERVSGRVGDRSGTFVLQDQGTLEGTTVSGRWFVVPGSGTAQLEGLRGEGGFTAQLGEGADVTLDYWFD